MSYDLYDNRGNRIGEIRDATLEWKAAALIALLGIGLFIMPYWAWYAIGKDTWRYRNIIVKLIDVLVIGIWVLIVLSLSSIEVSTLIFGALFFFGGWAIAYYIGKAARKE